NPDKLRGPRPITCQAEYNLNTGRSPRQEPARAFFTFHAQRWIGGRQAPLTCPARSGGGSAVASTAGRPKYAYFEGQIVPFEQATLSVMNHTFNYGTGAFGGLRGFWNDDEQELFVFRPLDHFKRLLNSARLLTFELDYTPQQLTDILFELLRAEGWRENIY